MIKRFFFVLTILLGCYTGFSQNPLPMNKAEAWADSALKTLSPDERIAQLMVVRLSSYDFKNKKPVYFDQQVLRLVQQYNVGGLCVFQGNPDSLADMLNKIQQVAKIPLMTCIDAEWGVGMRLFDNVQALPHQMMLGAMQDGRLVYQYGLLVGEQCRRLGIMVNYAPVVDINNNPDNPVINDRSFGEDKYKVAFYGTQYMRGLQQAGVMACAKHFPGHGDVSVDSHLDLPVIHKSLAQLQQLELYPFEKMFDAGVGSVMIAHLYIPAIDSTPNVATSLSRNNITELMRRQLGYEGLTFTDALEMQGVKKFFPNGEAAVRSLIAGNDMLCLPEDVPTAISKIKEAIRQNRLSWDDIDAHCKKVLLAKYAYGFTSYHPVDTLHLITDLNRGIAAMKKRVAEQSITLLRKTDPDFFPLLPKKGKKKITDIAVVSIGAPADSTFSEALKQFYHADVFHFTYNQTDSGATQLLDSLANYTHIVVGIHGYSRTPAANFGISAPAIRLINEINERFAAAFFVFGNPYAIKHWCNAKNIIACYEDDSLVQQTAFEILKGERVPQGTLPVSVCNTLPYGTGILPSDDYLPVATEKTTGLDTQRLAEIDSIVAEALTQKATPGCVVLVARNGRIAYQKAFGYLNYDSLQPVRLRTVYDLASVTKIAATTLAVMKLYDEGKINLSGRLSDYLPSTTGTDKANLLVRDLLLHQAGLVPFIDFYKETIDSTGKPLPQYYSSRQTPAFRIQVAEHLFLRNDWEDTLYKRILESPLKTPGKYVYSDNDFILLGKIVEAISGMPLNEYVEQHFYEPMGLLSMGYKPNERLPINRIAPTEDQKIFRRQLLRGYVHDPGAAMMGNIAGHAGLFSDAYDLAVLMQMLLNNGIMNGQSYLSKKTIALFTRYQSKASRRGYGFDKPEKHNRKRKDPYPASAASKQSFGHSGYTGTFIWADPKYDLVYVFLSNRVTPSHDNEKLIKMNIRTRIQQAVYDAFIK